MALTGNLEDIGLPDILQLIASGAKSGELSLSNREDEIRLVLSGGAVVYAENEQRPAASELGGRLVRGGVLTDEQLGTALSRRAQTGEPFIEVLVDEGFVRRDVIEAHARLEAIDLLLDLFTWTSGTFRFNEHPVRPETGWIEPVSIEWLLMNGVRMIDEWPRIAHTIGSLRLEVERLLDLPPPSAAGDTAYPDLVAGLDDLTESPAEPKPGEIGDQERLIYELADPAVSVRTLIARSYLTRLDACHALTVLIDGGYVRLVEPVELSGI